MMRVLVGQDVAEYKSLVGDLHRTEQMLRASEDRRKSAEHECVTLRARLESVQQHSDDQAARIARLEAAHESMHRRWNMALEHGVVQVAGSLYDEAVES